MILSKIATTLASIYMPPAQFLPYSMIVNQPKTTWPVMIKKTSGQNIKHIHLILVRFDWSSKSSDVDILKVCQEQQNKTQPIIRSKSWLHSTVSCKTPFCLPCKFHQPSENTSHQQGFEQSVHSKKFCARLQHKIPYNSWNVQGVPQKRFLDVWGKSCCW